MNFELKKNHKWRERGNIWNEFELLILWFESSHQSVSGALDPHVVEFGSDSTFSAD